MGKLKTGKFSKAEREYIAANIDKKTIDDIAKALNRTVSTIQKIVAELGLAKMDSEVAKNAILNVLHSSKMWNEIESQFTKDELKTFEAHWLEMYGQFKEDVWFTEQVQIRDFITHQIFIDRNLKAQSACIDDISRLEKSIELEYTTDPNTWTVDDKQRVFEMENQLAALRESNEMRQSQYLKINDAKQKILQNLKATRQQRIDKIVASKESIVGLMRMLEEEGQRENIGREAAIANIGAEMVMQKLMENHAYEDGEVDRPFLIPEHVEKLVTRLQDDDVQIPKDLSGGVDVALVDYLSYDGKEKLYNLLRERLESKDE